MTVDEILARKSGAIFDNTVNDSTLKAIQALSELVGWNIAQETLVALMSTLESKERIAGAKAKYSQDYASRFIDASMRALRSC